MKLTLANRPKHLIANRFATAAAALILFFATLAFPQPTIPPAIKERPQLAKPFIDRGVIGAFVMLDLSANVLSIHNPTHAKKRFFPASTFKILNALIGLEAGSAKNVDEVLPYGGKPQRLKGWEQDLSLRDAIKISSVPIFQELARRTGLQRMQSELRRYNYGNAEIGDSVDTFWLDGPLRISALEQIEFLRRLATGDLPADPKNIAAVRDITILESTPAYILHGKTGWAAGPEPDLGWFVGWIEHSGKIDIFALNIDMPSPDADAPKRIAIAKECLAILGKYPAPAPKETPSLKPSPVSR